MKLLERGQFLLLIQSSLEHNQQRVCPQGIKDAPLCLTIHTKQVGSTSSPPVSSSPPFYTLDPLKPICLSVSCNKSINGILINSPSFPSPPSSSSSSASAVTSYATTTSLVDIDRSSGNAVDKRCKTLHNWSIASSNRLHERRTISSRGELFALSP